MYKNGERVVVLVDDPVLGLYRKGDVGTVVNEGMFDDLTDVDFGPNHYTAVNRLARWVVSNHNLAPFMEIEDEP